eukprot:254372_1
MSTDRVWWYDAMSCDESNEECYKQWKTIHITALIPSISSSLASIFIIITGLKYHRKLSNLTFGAQLPIFISVSDLLFEIFHGGDHLHNLIKGYVSEQALCQLFGCMKPFSINCQTTWSLAVGLYLNRTIFNGSKIEPTFGKYNIYLHIFCWGIPFIIFICGFIFNVYGVEGPWCGVSNPTIDIFMVDIWIVFAIIILGINYSCIIYKLHSVVNNQQEQNDVGNFNNRIKKVIRTIGLYPIAYFFQWLAYTLFKAAMIPRTFYTLLWVVITGNMGGVFNLFLYGPLLLNQIKRLKREQRENSKQLKYSHTNDTTSQATVYSAQSHATTNELTPNVTSMNSNGSMDSEKTIKIGDGSSNH